MFDVNASLIRFWEKRFSIIKPRKNAKGNRLFSVEDVENLKIIYHLVKDKGMTLSGAEQYLKDHRIQVRHDVGVVEILQKLRATLVDMRNQIDSQHKASEDQIIIRNSCESMPSIELESEIIKPPYYEQYLFEFEE